MLSDDPVVQRCELRGAADLDALLLEHLDVDTSRMFVLYCEAILDLRVVAGTLTAARAFTVGSQGFARWVSDPNPETVIAEFCTELVEATDTTRR